ncbi:hypothetical protein ACIQ34_11440 [Ureibacillus sp. NPDC094379]
MTQISCSKCNRSLNPEDIIKTDEFKEYGSEVKNYCASCFIEGAKIGFGNISLGNCEVCDNPLVLQYDDKETISLAKEDFTVHYICKKVKDAIAEGKEEEVERLEKEVHSELIIYTIEPDPEEPDFG